MLDPFEEDDSTNLATLSGRDPFNNDFVGNATVAGLLPGRKEEAKQCVPEVAEVCLMH